MTDFDNNGREREEIYSKAVRAGKRTYFFDVKSTRGNDFYLTITESKKRFADDKSFYEKHKLFLYKEDFDKFIEGLQETIEHIQSLKDEAPSMEESVVAEKTAETITSDFSISSFEELGINS